MDTIGFGCPVYILREECKKDLMGVLERLAEAGFDGVELLGLFGENPEVIRKGVDKIGLKVMGDHIPYSEFVSHTKQVIEDHVTLGTPFISIDRLPNDKTPGTSGFGDLKKQIEEIGHLCNEAGLTLLYHNHGFDLIKKVNEKHRLEVFLDAISPEYLSFLPDLGWIALGGGDPEHFLHKYSTRCPVIHLKDYYSSKPICLGSPVELGENRGGEEYNHFEFRPTGYGVMNYPQLINSVLDCNPKWLVADHDIAYEREAFDDLKDSLVYMKNLVSYARY